MDQKSKTNQAKKIIDVEIFCHDDRGYGPDGELTRREWRKECWDNLMAGKDAFNSWQTTWTNRINPDLPKMPFAARINHDDGSYLIVLDDDSGREKLPWSIDFVGQYFANYLNISSDIVFMQTTLFAGAIFESTLNLSRSEFKGDADFSYVNFKENVVFFGSTFEWKTNFSHITCLSKTDFSRTKFNRDANFKQAIFVNDSSFSGTVFNEYANFCGAIFSGQALFVKTQFLSTSIFESVIFNKKSDFENATFDNIGHFEDANFASKIPAFRGCKIDGTRLEFTESTKFPNNDVEAGAIENISFLKRLSDEHGQTDQALRFNALELNAKHAKIQNEIKNIYPIFRLKEANWWFMKITYLYKFLSNYGQSFTRPILCYGVLICFGALLAMGYSTYSERPAKELQVLCKPIKDQPPPLKLSYERAVFEYAMFRAGGVMDFTDTGKQNNAVNCRLFDEPIEPPLMRAWGVFKGIASIALLFLAALGLRNKYRIK